MTRIDIAADTVEALYGRLLHPTPREIATAIVQTLDNLDARNGVVRMERVTDDTGEAFWIGVVD